MPPDFPSVMPDSSAPAGARVAGELPSPAVLRRELPLPNDVVAFVGNTRESVRRIISGSDPRLLVVLGPCSVHDAGAAMDYARRLKPLQESVADALLLVMRVYVEKPRTRGGWKGLVNDPHLDGSCRIDEGLRIARQLMLDVNSLGVPVATEFVEVATPAWLGDLVSWSAVGARSVESQLHRQMASGLPCPVGFKNGTRGDVGVAVNAMSVAVRPQHGIGVSDSGQLAAVETPGNANVHLVLRGGVTANHDAESVRVAQGQLAEFGLPSRVMVDCGHGNARADGRGQYAVAQDVMAQVAGGSEAIMGVMLESNLIAGCQPFVPGCPLRAGLSVTDPCMGLDDTSHAIEQLAQARREAREHAAGNAAVLARHG